MHSLFCFVAVVVARQALVTLDVEPGPALSGSATVTVTASKVASAALSIAFGDATAPPVCHTERGAVVAPGLFDVTLASKPRTALRSGPWLVNDDTVSGRRVYVANISGAMLRAAADGASSHTARVVDGTPHALVSACIVDGAGAALGATAATVCFDSQKGEGDGDGDDGRPVVAAEVTGVYGTLVDGLHVAFLTRVRHGCACSETSPLVQLRPVKAVPPTASDLKTGTRYELLPIGHSEVQCQEEKRTILGCTQCVQSWDATVVSEDREVRDYVDVVALFVTDDSGDRVAVHLSAALLDDLALLIAHDENENDVDGHGFAAVVEGEAEAEAGSGSKHWAAVAPAPVLVPIDAPALPASVHIAVTTQTDPAAYAEHGARAADLGSGVRILNDGERNCIEVRSNHPAFASGETRLAIKEAVFHACSASWRREQRITGADVPQTCPAAGDVVFVRNGAVTHGLAGFLKARLTSDGPTASLCFFPKVSVVGAGTFEISWGPAAVVATAPAYAVRRDQQQQEEQQEQQEAKFPECIGFDCAGAVVLPARTDCRTGCYFLSHLDCCLPWSVNWVTWTVLAALIIVVCVCFAVCRGHAKSCRPVCKPICAPPPCAIVHRSCTDQHKCQ